MICKLPTSGSDSTKMPHNLPLRRILQTIPRQLGYKNVKYLSRILVTDSPKGIGDGLGSGAPAAGYSWYAGI